MDFLKWYVLYNILAAVYLAATVKYFRRTQSLGDLRELEAALQKCSKPKLVLLAAPVWPILHLIIYIARALRS